MRFNSLISQKNPSRPLGRVPETRGQFRAGRQILLWALCTISRIMNCGSLSSLATSIRLSLDYVEYLLAERTRSRLA
jgi:hypothetical protein